MACNCLTRWRKTLQWKAAAVAYTAVLLACLLSAGHSSVVRLTVDNSIFTYNESTNTVTASEPELGSTTDIVLNITSDSPLEASVSYMQISLEPSTTTPGASYVDFYQTQEVSLLKRGETSTSVQFSVRHDDIPEILESFTFVLAVTYNLVGTSGEPTTVDTNHGVMRLNIVANDFPFGRFQFSSWDKTLHTEEGGTLRIAVERLGGSFGHVAIDAQVEHFPGEASSNDVLQSTRTFYFAPGQIVAHANISIASDEIPEPVETFSVKLVDVTVSFNGKIEDMDTLIVTERNSVLVEIDESNFPRGLFGFSTVSPDYLINCRKYVLCNDVFLV